MQVITPRLLCSYKSFLRASLYFSTNKNPSKLTVECLNHRGLLRVSGEDVAPFMQGLITNDMKHLTEGGGSMYTMFLNTKGRVLFDAIMYKSPTPDTYLIESDLECLPALQKHLKMYRIRRKIDIDLLDNEYKVWVVFDSSTTDNLINPLLTPTPQGLIVPCTALKDTMTQQNEVMLQGPGGLLMYVDPRLAALGSRFLVTPSTTSEDIARYLGTNITCADMDYKEFRYKLGVGEGVGDLPPGNCFPLEANCDYLHGVSFHKGCYIGQELTARTHHTGVVRKRLMPLLLEQELTMNLEPDTPITTLPETKTPVGKLRGIQGKTALGLLRIAPALVAQKLRIAGPVGVLGTTVRPAWWPIEAPKEKANIETKN